MAVLRNKKGFTRKRDWVQELNSFISYATEKGIRIGADEKSRGHFDQYYGESSILYEMVDGLTDSIRFARSMGLKVPDSIILNYDNVLGYQKDNSKIDIDAFASTKGKTITLNKFMFDDSTYLKRQYNDALKEEMFPKGTSYKNIVNHEFGHILDKYNPGLRKIIINRLSNTFPICRTIQYRQTGLNSSEDVRACA